MTRPPPNAPGKRAIADFVRAAATRAGLTTAADIADAAGWTRRYLYRVMADPGIFDLRRLAELDRALHLAPGTLAAQYYASNDTTRKDTVSHDQDHDQPHR